MLYFKIIVDLHAFKKYTGYTDLVYPLQISSHNNITRPVEQCHNQNTDAVKTQHLDYHRILPVTVLWPYTFPLGNH